MGVQYKDRRLRGHAFIAEQVNGKTLFIEPQTNPRDLSFILSDKFIKPESVKYIRVDNNDFTEEIWKAVDKND